MQLVDGNGEFMAADLDKFAQENSFGDLKQAYQIEAIMGPQSSGKSTLLNHLVRGGSGSRVPHVQDGDGEHISYRIPLSPDDPPFICVVRDILCDDGCP